MRPLRERPARAGFPGPSGVSRRPAPSVDRSPGIGSEGERRQAGTAAEQLDGLHSATPLRGDALTLARPAAVIDSSDRDANPAVATFLSRGQSQAAWRQKASVRTSLVARVLLLEGRTTRIRSLV